ncbi:hypothetical protein V8C37DRAFT_397379 [Trichoderma ceciliae]
MSSPLSLPASSIEATIKTNRNTQRLGESAVDNSQSDGQNSVSPAPPSLFRQRDYDIQPTLFKVDKTHIPACVCWNPERNIDISLDLHRARQHAFIKLRTRLCLQSAPGTSQQSHRNVYIFIYPERIRELLYTAQPKYEPFGPSTRALTFHLKRPSALILPKTDTEFVQEAKHTIRSLYDLVKQLSFTVYVNLPFRKVKQDWMEEFCKEITEQKLISIVSIAKWKILYQGHREEAEAIEGESLLEPVIDRDDAAAPGLPPYEEIGPTIPLKYSTKRKRSWDESFTTAQTVQDTAAVQAPIRSVQDVELVAYQRKLEEMFSTRERRLEEMFSARERKVEARERELEELISTHALEVRQADDGLIEHIDQRIDDGLVDAREYVLQTVTSMPLQASITFPLHPLY